MSDTRVIAYLGENFVKVDGAFCATQTSAAFIQDTFGKSNVKVCGGIDLKKKSGFSSYVDAKDFYEFQTFSSIKDFLLQSLFKRGWYKEFIKRCDAVIDENQGALFWVRTPSIGSVVFATRALKKNQKLINHICADISNTWKDPKYNFFEKMVGFVFSKFLLHKLQLVCLHPGTVANLCTGDKLFNFSSKFSASKTHQFVDLMSSTKEISFNLKSLSKQQLKVLFVGRIAEDKGVFDLLAVAKKLDYLQVNIVGGGPDLDRLSSDVLRLGLSDRVNLYGQVPFEELESFYKSSDVVAVPSNNHYEGFPRVIMEAWSHHKPVIVSNVGGIKAFVKNNENGLIISPGNVTSLEKALEQVFSSEKLYLDLQQGAYNSSKYASKRYWMETVKDLLQAEISDEK